MPTYAYMCDCGREWDVVKPMAEYQRPETCECGDIGYRALHREQKGVSANGYPARLMSIAATSEKNRREWDAHYKAQGCPVTWGANNEPIATGPDHKRAIAKAAGKVELD